MHSKLSRLVNLNPTGNPIGKLMKGSVAFNSLENKIDRLRPITTQNERQLALMNVTNK